MKKKFFLLFFGLNLISLNSCFEHCKDYKFFDYQNIEVSVENPEVSQNDSLSFGIQYLNIEYLSSRSTQFDFGNNLHAFTSCDKGYGGEKYPLSRIKITSDSDFNDAYPAQSELNEIVTIRGTNANGEYVLGHLNDFDPSDLNIGYMWISDRPTLDSNHHLTIEIEKSNGDVLSATSMQIIWE